MFTSAPIAIAAMAALHTAPAVAQQQPQIVLDIPEAQPSPTIVLPGVEVSTAEPVTAPVETEQAATTAAEAAAADPQVQSTAPVTQAEAPAPAAAAAEARAPIEPAPISDTALPSGETAPVPASETALAVSDAPSASVSEIAANRAELAPAPAAIEDFSGTALLLALIGVGGIGLLAFFLMRRRRRTEVPVIEKPIVAHKPANASATLLDREPQVGAFDASHRTTAVSDPAPVATTAARTSGDAPAVELPREIPATYEGRSSLLRRMIAARPDRANPFRSPKARARRARLIMQSIGTRFTERKPWIDLSQYTNVWPELRGWRPATA